MESKNCHVDYDTLIIGAGLSGVRALIEAQQLGFKAVVVEAGSGVGGCWYWNRYPGARTDSEAQYYCYGFDSELADDWDWPERYPTAAQMRDYLNHVTDRYDLRPHIKFNTHIEAAEWNQQAAAWQIRIKNGETLVARTVITAVGPLSKPYVPDIPGKDSFAGETYLTARWPDNPELEGKRIGIIGSGSSAVQSVPLLAQTAAQLTVFQRTPTYVLPARNEPLDTYQMSTIKRDYEKIRATIQNDVAGFGAPLNDRTMSEISAEEREKVLERAWEAGAFNFSFQCFADYMYDKEANDYVANFVRERIRAMVKDPATAELLCPAEDQPFGAKRHPSGTGYYQTFNRDNVSLVDVKSNPIVEIVPEGVQLSDGTVHELDVLIFATGFDAVTGCLTAIDFKGVNGLSINSAWAEGADSFLGVATKGFPNLFMIGGPLFVMGNFTPFAEKAVEWIFQLLCYMKENRQRTIEAKQSAVDEWRDEAYEFFGKTFLNDGGAFNSYFLGSNIPGKANKPLFHAGGFQHWKERMRQCSDNGYLEFNFSEITNENVVSLAQAK